jgi:NADPH2:quinone reductase
MGQLVAFGQSAGPVPPFDPAVLSGIHPVGGPGSLTLTWPTLNDHNATPELRRWRAAEVFELVVQGVLKPEIDATLGLSEAAEAHRRLEQGNVLGKLVLDVRR